MIEYRGELISRNSEAYEMWLSKDFKKLDSHLKKLKQNQVDLLKHYEKFETV